jgi:hypothetical protein
MNADLARLVAQSLEGSPYDVARVVLHLMAGEFVCASVRHRIWFAFDSSSRRWACTEIGPYKQLSTVVVDAYRAWIDHVGGIDSPAAGDVARAEAIVTRLKSVTFKERVMRECLYIFHENDFLLQLDACADLVPFRDGVLDLASNRFRACRRDDYVSLYIDDDYDAHGSDEQASTIKGFVAYRDLVHSKRRALLLPGYGGPMRGGNSNNTSNATVGSPSV